MSIDVQFTVCPDPACQLPAEVSERFQLGSTDGPIDYVRTYCVRRHIFTVPADRVATLEPMRS